MNINIDHDLVNDHKMEKYTYYLILDDLRTLNQVDNLCDVNNKIPSDYPFILVRNYDEFVKCIESNGLPIKYWSDHDLGFEHMRDYFNVVKDEDKILDPLKLNYAKYKEKTGYDCAKWLVEYCMNKGLDIPEYYVHSMNSIGKRNIISYLESYKKSLIK
jgi:hypothetical protein